MTIILNVTNLCEYIKDTLIGQRINVYKAVTSFKETLIESSNMKNCF